MVPATPGVKPVIPLNKDDPTYNLWKKIREDLSKGREPGPIKIQRFPGALIPQGILAFFRSPLLSNPRTSRPVRWMLRS